MKPFSFKYLTSACLMVASAGTVHAVGLGSIHSDSPLGSPLSATIAVLGGEELSTNDVIVTLGQPEDYRRLQVEWLYVHQSINFEPEIKDGQFFVRLTTNKPIVEPFLNFVVTLRDPKGDLFREYTILLDPPADIQAATGKNSALNAPLTTDAASTKEALKTTPTQQSVIDPAIDKKNAQYDSKSMYQIQSGDSLWRIARRLRPSSSISIAKMMNAIYIKNPSAFVRSDPGRIKQAYRLHLPNMEEIAAAKNSMPTASSRVAAAQPSSHASAVNTELYVAAPLERQQQQPKSPSANVSAVNRETVMVKSDAKPLNKSQASPLQVAPSQVALSQEEQQGLANEKNIALRERLTALEAQRLLLVDKLKLQSAELSSARSALNVDVEIDNQQDLALTADNVEPMATNKASEEVAASEQAGQISAINASVSIGDNSVLAPIVEAFEQQGVSSRQETIFSRFVGVITASAMLLLFALMGVAWLIKKRRQKPVTADGNDSKLPYWQMPVRDLSHLKSRIGNEPASGFIPPGKSSLSDKIDYTSSPIELSKLSMKHGAYSTAEKILKKALDDDPLNIELKLQLMRVYEKTKDFVEYSILSNEIEALAGEEPAKKEIA